ncbi:hypothetical protein MMMB2_2034 [Mycobacterium marinum MB2]|nr:hypothetical protein MMMB2_2034 [Mycobacterium marinum MB2]
MPGPAPRARGAPCSDPPLAPAEMLYPARPLGSGEVHRSGGPTRRLR